MQPLSSHATHPVLVGATKAPRKAEATAILTLGVLVLVGAYMVGSAAAGIVLALAI